MRKIFSLGLFALMLSIFSGQALAGNALDCELLKQTKNKSLYGLCVAWHNADETAKLGIADKFFDRAGFTVPGSDTFDCYCWGHLSYDEVCDIANSPTATPIKGENAITFMDYLLTQFGADKTSCTLLIYSYSLEGFIELITSEDSSYDPISCMAEVQVISTFPDNEDLCPSN
jgi:hypothetical protein